MFSPTQSEPYTGGGTAQPAIPPAKILRRKNPPDRFFSRYFSSGGVLLDRARTFWFPHGDAEDFCNSCVGVMRSREVNLVSPTLKSSGMEGKRIAPIIAALNLLYFHPEIPDLN